MLKPSLFLQTKLARAEDDENVFSRPPLVDRIRRGSLSRAEFRREFLHARKRRYRRVRHENPLRHFVAAAEKHRFRIRLALVEPDERSVRSRMHGRIFDYFLLVVHDCFLLAFFLVSRPSIPLKASPRIPR